MTVLFGEEKGSLVIFVQDGNQQYRVPPNNLKMATRYRHRSQLEAYIKAEFHNIKASASIKVTKQRQTKKGTITRFQLDLDIEVDAFFDSL